VLIAKVWNLISNDQQCDTGTSYNGKWILNKQNSVSVL
jgi:hypothetical protein